MSRTVCLAANTIRYQDGGGHLWAYLNWALGLRAVGCRVVWLEEVFDWEDAAELAASQRRRLGPYGIADLALFSPAGQQPPDTDSLGCLDAEDVAAECDLLLNMAYDVDPALVRRFRRSAVVDIDPGLLQWWLDQRYVDLAPHDVYFTIGETIGRPGSRCSDAGLPWTYTPPCVAAEWWPQVEPEPNAAFTTVSNWASYDEWVEDGDEEYQNDKREGFRAYLDLPASTSLPLELALALGDDDEDERDRADLLARGWRVRDVCEVASTPWEYQRYVRSSLGEFSCAKPSCVRFQTAWVSDRTLCYLASGRPAVVEHTGPSRILPDREGMLRFRTPEEAVECLELATSPHQRRLARELVLDRFDAPQTLPRVLDVALDAQAATL